MAQIQMLSPVAGGKVRGMDAWGEGHYGASRGARTHYGLDITAQVITDVVSPIDGKVIRDAYPYANDKRYKGLVVEGTGQHSGFEIKLFYVEGSPNIVGQLVLAGDLIGKVQDLTIKYPAISNHIHLEIKQNGQYIDPAFLLNITP